MFIVVKDHIVGYSPWFVKMCLIKYKCMSLMSKTYYTFTFANQVGRTRIPVDYILLLFSLNRLILDAYLKPYKFYIQIIKITKCTNKIKIGLK